MLTAVEIEGFVEGILRKTYDNPAEIPECHREWWEMCCSKRKFVAIAAPRGHAKSTAITLGWTLGQILFRERSFVLLVSDTETQATFFLNDLKNRMIENPDIVSMFGIKPVKEWPKDSASDFIVEFNDGHQARVIAKGSGQSLRGILWNSKRPNLILCDDLENDEIPCLSKNGILRVVGTILHQDSQLENLMPKRGYIGEETDLKIVSNNKATWYSAKYKAHDKKLEKALWPENKPISWLIEQRNSYIEQGMMDMWSQEMLNVPLDEERALFRKMDFQPLEEDWKTKTMHYYVGTDFALSLQQQRDFTCFVIGAVDEKGQLSIVHVIHGRMDSSEIEETIFQINAQWKPEMFFFEKGQILLGLEPHLINGMSRRGNYFNYESMSSITDKTTRSSSIRSRMRVGAVKFDKNADWFPDFEDECLKFPRDVHDDYVDALSLLGRGLNKFIEAPTPEEEAEEAFEREKEIGGFYGEGRDDQTGY
jgi:predicted phage terminase large subunit-like protein